MREAWQLLNDGYGLIIKDLTSLFLSCYTFKHRRFYPRKHPYRWLQSAVAAR